MEIDPAYAELLGKLNALKTTERKKALRKSLRKAGGLIKDAIVARAPVQTGEAHGVLKPGELKESFRSRVHVAEDEDAASDSDRVTIGPTRKTIDIAEHVETGHENRVRTVPRKTKRVDRTPPNPFVRPAFDATKDPALALFEETMAGEIKKVMNA